MFRSNRLQPLVEACEKSRNDLFKWFGVGVRADHYVPKEMPAGDLGVVLGQCVAAFAQIKTLLGQQANLMAEQQARIKALEEASVATFYGGDTGLQVTYTVQQVYERANAAAERAQAVDIAVGMLGRRLSATEQRQGSDEQLLAAVAADRPDNDIMAIIAPALTDHADTVTKICQGVIQLVEARTVDLHDRLKRLEGDKGSPTTFNDRMREQLPIHTGLPSTDRDAEHRSMLILQAVDRIERKLINMSKRGAK